MKKLILTIISVLVLTTCNGVNNNISEPVEIEPIETATSVFQPNQTTLYYSHSNNEYHYFIDPLADYESTIAIGVSDWMIDSNYTIDTDSLYEGKQFVGTFDIEYEWELLAIEEME